MNSASTYEWGCVDHKRWGIHGNKNISLTYHNLSSCQKKKKKHCKQKHQKRKFTPTSVLSCQQVACDFKEEKLLSLLKFSIFRKKEKKRKEKE
jgi:hypothetical protein